MSQCPKPSSNGCGICAAASRRIVAASSSPMAGAAPRMRASARSPRLRSVMTSRNSMPVMVATVRNPTAKTQAYSAMSPCRARIAGTTRASAPKPATASPIARGSPART